MTIFCNDSVMLLGTHPASLTHYNLKGSSKLTIHATQGRTSFKTIYFKQQTRAKNQSNQLEKLCCWLISQAPFQPSAHLVSADKISCAQSPDMLLKPLPQQLARQHGFPFKQLRIQTLQ